MMSKFAIALVLTHTSGISAEMTVQCRIDSQQFLDSEVMDRYTESYVLFGATPAD